MTSPSIILPSNETKNNSKARLNDFLKKYATILSIITSAVMSITGVMVFFHLGNNYVMGLHEWVGMAFVVALLFHVMRHLKPFMKYFTKIRTKVLVVIMICICIGFIAPTVLTPNGGNPLKKFTQASMKAPIFSIAPIVGRDGESLIEMLEKQGITGVTQNQSLQDISKSHNVPIQKLYSIVLNK